MEMKQKKNKSSDKINIIEDSNTLQNKKKWKEIIIDNNNKNKNINKESEKYNKLYQYERERDN
jgi:hypothetical protein